LFNQLCELSQTLQLPINAQPSHLKDRLVSAIQLAISKLDFSVLSRRYIVILTSFHPDDSSAISEAVEAAALRSGSQLSQMAFTVLILNLHPLESQTASVTPQSPPFNMGVICDIQTVPCGSLVEYMSQLVKQHYNLHCSIITGIPMKVNCLLDVLLNTS
jgi:hypothetical protein